MWHERHKPHTSDTHKRHTSDTRDIRAVSDTYGTRDAREWRHHARGAIGASLERVCLPVLAQVVETIAQMFNMGLSHYAETIAEGDHLAAQQGQCTGACKSTVGDGLIKVGKYYERAMVWMDRPCVSGSVAEFEWPIRGDACAADGLRALYNVAGASLCTNDDVLDVAALMADPANSALKADYKDVVQRAILFIDMKRRAAEAEEEGNLGAQRTLAFEPAFDNVGGLAGARSFLQKLLGVSERLFSWAVRRTLECDSE